MGRGANRVQSDSIRPAGKPMSPTTITPGQRLGPYEIASRRR